MKIYTVTPYLNIQDNHSNPPTNNYNLVTHPYIPTSPENITDNLKSTNKNVSIVDDPYFQHVLYDSNILQKQFCDIEKCFSSSWVMMRRNLLTATSNKRWSKVNMD